MIAPQSAARHGFELVREQSLAEINSTARYYRRAKIGAELLSLVNTDENKVFGVSLATPPAAGCAVVDQKYPNRYLCAKALP
jgi:Zn-dependent M16 (insulinase) family peptidase